MANQGGTAVNAFGERRFNTEALVDSTDGRDFRLVLAELSGIERGRPWSRQLGGSARFGVGGKNPVSCGL